MSDLIDREKFIYTLIFSEKTKSIFVKDLRSVIEVANEIPSEKPERKKGKWNFIGDNMFECTHCGVVYTTQQLNGLRNYAVDPYAPRFCPNCGTEMLSGEEKDE